jgi:two-component system nitrogen regulation sensor histidine kinase GlnL
MANVYNFTVNNKMFVDAWDERITELTGEAASVAAGKKYYDVFPPLIFRDKDAVAFSIEKQRKLVLKGYIFNCLFSRVTADIMIKPVATLKGIKGAAIKVSNVSVSDTRRPEEIYRLIALGKTAASLAHGLRNPLNAISGAVTYISQKYAHEKVLIEFANIMQEEISQLDRFISGFLATSISDMRPCLVDVNSLLKKVEILISLQTRARSIRSDFKYGVIPQVLINPFQLEQAVLNTINNALDAMPSDGGLTIKTGLEKSDEKEFVIIEISDSGPGMPGNSSSDNMTRKKRGKGFGLLITEEIMNHYDGRMDIKSMKDRGTTVRLFIPTNAAGGTNEKKL